MPKHKTTDRIRIALETAAEIIEIIKMILPLFESKGRKKNN